MINHFHEKTPDEVRKLLKQLWHTKTIVRLVYGDPMTGQQWLEENDVVGYIGSSTGAQKIPLIIEPLVHSRFEVKGDSGGPGILDQCILRVLSCETGRELYRHPNYVEPVLSIRTITDTDLIEKGCTFEVLRFDEEKQGKVHARFPNFYEACAYVAFQTGHLTHMPFRTLGEKRREDQRDEQP